MAGCGVPETHYFLLVFKNTLATQRVTLGLTGEVGIANSRLLPATDTLLIWEQTSHVEAGACGSACGVLGAGASSQITLGLPVFMGAGE